MTWYIDIISSTSDLESNTSSSRNTNHRSDENRVTSSTDYDTVTSSTYSFISGCIVIDPHGYIFVIDNCQVVMLDKDGNFLRSLGDTDSEVTSTSNQ